MHAMLTLSGQHVPFSALPTCVPRVVAGGPGQVPGKGVGEVEDSPRQHYDVVDVQQGHNHLRSEAHSWGEQSQMAESAK